MKKIFNRIFIDGLSGMALGLFASLLMATIFGTVLKCVPDGNVLHNLLLQGF
ncbi:MAG: hypothetical protein IKT78_03130 [Ruminiclostridium sp.]|nr:hypothetical protein [Ruminiclostridium sp.]